MTKTENHTPTPLTVGKPTKLTATEYPVIPVLMASRGDPQAACIVYSTIPYAMERAELIARAVNSHAALVEALETLLNHYTFNPVSEEMARAALTLAKGA